MKCIKCKRDFYYTPTKKDFCTLRCTGNNRIGIYQQHKNLDWKEMWRNFFIRYYSLPIKKRDDYLTDMLKLMPERYINNKDKHTYNLFTPNNI